MPKEDATTTTNDELVGQLTMVLMALFGMLLYSLVIGLLTIGTGVAVLELSMVWSHLMVVLICAVLQLVLTPMLPETFFPGLSYAQSSVLGGVAMGITWASVICCSYGECEGYFPAAVFPKASAIAATTWAWIIYLASIGAQSTTQQSLSLAFTTPAGAWSALTAAAITPSLALRRSSACSAAVLQAPDVAWIWTLFAACILAQLGLALATHAAEETPWGSRLVGGVVQLVALGTATVCVLVGPMLPYLTGPILLALALHLFVVQAVLPCFCSSAPASSSGGRRKNASKSV